MRYSIFAWFLLLTAPAFSQVPDSVRINVEAGYGKYTPLAQQVIDSIAGGDIRIIALGEATHGGREINQFRGAFLFELLQQNKLDMVVLEAPLGSMAAYYFYDSTTYEKEVAFWPWCSRELKYAFDSLRRYNAVHPERPVLIAGMDAQVTNFQGHLAAKILATHFPEDTAGIRFDALENFSDTTNRFLQMDRLLLVLQKREAALKEKLPERQFRFLQYALRTLQQSRDLYETERRSGSWSSSQFRDSCMAVNTIWLRENFGGAGYTVVIAHNLHVTADSIGYAGGANMGWYIKQHYRDRYYILRMEFYEGSSWGLDFSYSRNTGGKYTWTSRYFPVSGKKDIAAYWMRLCPDTDCFTDLRRPPKENIPLNKFSKQLGAVFYKRTILRPFRNVDADGILFFHAITPFTQVKTRQE